MSTTAAALILKCQVRSYLSTCWPSQSLCFSPDFHDWNLLQPPCSREWQFWISSGNYPWENFTMKNTLVSACWWCQISYLSKCWSSQSLCFSPDFHDSGIFSSPSLHPSMAPATQALESASPPWKSDKKMIGWSWDCHNVRTARSGGSWL